MTKKVPDPVASGFEAEKTRSLSHGILRYPLVMSKFFKIAIENGDL
jgi:hypothetical protein